MEMKFRAHDTFFIRKGWLSKGMRHVAQAPDVFISREENPMDVLGIGANMVKALRYWMQVTGLTEEPSRGRRVQTFTPLGERIFEHDTYIEELGTLQLLQYRLASQNNDATAWYYFFNEFNMTEFGREDFVRGLENFIKMNSETDDENEEKSRAKTVAIRSLNDDFACIINTYVPRLKISPNKVSPENNIDCPFGELGLVDVLDSKNKTYRKSIPAASAFNPWVILAIIVEQAGDEKSIPLNDLLTKKCNIGRTFNLDAICMMDILHNVEKTGEIKIIRTAGLDVVRILNDLTFDGCVDRYYADIEGERL